MMRIYPRALLGSALTSSSTSCLQHSVRKSFEGKCQTASKLSHARKLTTRQHEMTQRPSSRPPGRLHLREVRTLDPTKLTPRDHINLSHLIRANVVFVPSTPTPGNVSGPRGFVIRATHLLNDGFPPNTTGFLYYHVPPYSSPLAGEVRFRITPSSDPDSFATGSDLLMENGVPWRIPLLYVAGRDAFNDLHALLLQDGLVTPQVLDSVMSVEAIMKKGEDHIKGGSSVTAIISSFKRGFSLRFGRHANGAWVIIGQDTVARRYIAHVGSFRVPVHGIMRTVQYFPFRGIGPRSCCHSANSTHDHII